MNPGRALGTAGDQHAVRKKATYNATTVKYPSPTADAAVDEGGFCHAEMPKYRNNGTITVGLDLGFSAASGTLGELRLPRRPPLSDVAVRPVTASRDVEPP